MTKPAYIHPVEEIDEHGGVVNRYGFQWGPLRVIRLGHIEPHGYNLAVQTEHDEVEIHVSEHGRRISVVVRDEP